MAYSFIFCLDINGFTLYSPGFFRSPGAFSQTIEQDTAPTPRKSTGIYQQNGCVVNLYKVLIHPSLINAHIKNANTAIDPEDKKINLILYLLNKRLSRGNTTPPSNPEKNQSNI
jgi:hypothetical protein